MVGAEKPKAKGIPSWQLNDGMDSPSLPEQASLQESTEETASSERAALIRNAAIFLKDEDIRNSSFERKQAFLKSKGLSDDEIQELLQTQSTTEGEIADGFQEDKQQAPIQDFASDSGVPQEALPTPPTKDVPPIITYPEFLIHSQKPPPLITAQRLLTTLYLSSGAAATIYGTNKFMIEPMVESLSSARHSLFETAAANLSTLNEKLQKVASKIPETVSTSDDSEIGSIESDPARFFTRSAATQTSPDHSTSSNPFPETLGPQSSPILMQEAALLDIHDRLEDLLPADAEAPSPIKASLDDLQKYLEGLAYSDAIGQSRTGAANDNALAKVKADIRGMKGVLLSARNFPSGVAVR